MTDHEALVKIAESLERIELLLKHRLQLPPNNQPYMQYFPGHDQDLVPQQVYQNYALPPEYFN